jgi:hypothetical protein
MSPKPNRKLEQQKKPNGSECGGDHRPGDSRKIACRQKNNTWRRLKLWACTAEIRNPLWRRGANQDFFDDVVADWQQ